MLQAGGGRIPDVWGAWGVRVGVRCCEVGVVERRSEEQSSRLEALPRSLPSGSQSCLICVDRTHLAKIGQAGWGGWLARAAAFAASLRMVVNTMSESRLFKQRRGSRFVLPG